MNRVDLGDANVFCIADLERHATAKMRTDVAEYYNEGAMDLVTLRDNVKAFDRVKLRPRVAINVSQIDTTTTCFGAKNAMPLGFAPAAMHKMAHPIGEVGTSAAAADHGVNMILSLYATSSIEDVVRAGSFSDNAYGQQMCVAEDLETTRRTIRRVEASGARAIVLSMDVPVLSKRLNEHRNNWTLSPDYELPNIPEGVDVHNALPDDPRITYSKEVTWTLLRELIRETALPVYLKGITHPEDALRAVEVGATGVIVSTHGGRQLDGAIAALDVLEEVVDAVGGRIQVHFDSGIRRGSDIFKALAIGADYCWVGRIPIWGLAYNGQAGVKLALELLHEELQTTMRLCGCKSIKEISRAHIARVRPDGRYESFPPRRVAYATPEMRARL